VKKQPDESHNRLAVGLFAKNNTAGFNYNSL
jgi:hypothetical protein